MLTLLLDERISPDVAAGFLRRYKAPEILPLAEWKNGDFLGQSDEALLTAAAAENVTLVTYDRRTIPLLLKHWAESGRNHGGVIFIDDKTIPPSDFGGIIRALAQLSREDISDWTNQVWFLRK